MELIEKLPLLKIQFLDSLSFNEFKPFCKSSIKNEEDRRKQYNIMKEYCRTNIKTRGETKRIYSYTLKTPLDVGGRLYSGSSIQGLSSKIRGFLFGDITTDIDMKNAHPTILQYLCNLNDIKCPNLTYYIEHRDELLIEYGADFKTELQSDVMFHEAISEKCLNLDVNQKIILEKIIDEIIKQESSGKTS